MHRDNADPLRLCAVARRVPDLAGEVVPGHGAAVGDEEGLAVDADGKALVEAEEEDFGGEEVRVHCIVDVDVLEEFLIGPNLEGGFPLVHHLEEGGDDLEIAAAVNGRQTETEGSEAPGVRVDDSLFGEGFGLLVRCCV